MREGSFLPSQACCVILHRRGQNRVKSVGVLLQHERVSVFTDTAQDDLKVAPEIQSNSVQTGVFEFGPVQEHGLTDNETLAPTSHEGGGGTMAPPKNQEAISTTEEVTTFHDELPPVQTETQSFTTFDTRLLAPVESAMSKDIKKFLSRPVIVAEFKIATSSSSGTILYSENIPKNWLHSSGTNQVAMWQRKIEGFSVVRGTLKIRVQINPQRFQQGRFIMTFFPQADLMPLRAGMAQRQSFTLMTQLPRVELDCAANSSATLEIPYVSPVLGYNYVTGEYGHGVVNLTVYSPLVDPSGTGDIGCTIWASWTDIELMFPCQPQAGGRAVQEEEEGSLTSLFKSVNRVATKASSIPLLSSIAKPVSWASSIASKVSSAFGWANPRDTQRASNMMLKAAPYMQNVDAVDESQTLAFTSGNLTQILPGAFGNDKDELAILDIVQRSSYVNQFTITTSNVAGDLLFSQELSPWNYVSTHAQSVTGKTIYYPTPLAAVANMFTQWRGSTTFTFKFVKTEFHSTRVMLVYSPPQASTVTFAANEYMFREVYDLRETNEITLTVPFVSSQQYIDRNTTSAGFKSAGWLYMYLVNELKAPTTVSDTISVLVEVAGGPDTEFAVPQIQQTWTPGVYWIDTPESPVLNIAPGFRSLAQERKEVYILQALGTDQTQAEKTISTDPSKSAPIGTSEVNSGGLAASAFCIGEKIVSLRQILKRSAIYCSTDVPTKIFIANGTMCSSTTTTSATTYPHAGNILDYWGQIAPWYMYRRGGSRIKFIDCNVAVPTEDQNIIWTCRLLTNRAINQTLLAPFDTNLAGTTSFISNATVLKTVTGAMEIEIPFYSLTPIQVIGDMAYSTNGLMGGFPYPELMDSQYAQFACTYSFGEVQIWRQAADDTEFGYFVGALPYMSNTDITYPGFIV